MAVEIFLLYHFLSAAKFHPFPNVDPLNPAREKMPLRFFLEKIGVKAPMFGSNNDTIHGGLLRLHGTNQSFLEARKVVWVTTDQYPTPIPTYLDGDLSIICPLA